MIEVIFEDNHLLVVNKPPGLLTQPSGTDQDNLEDQCKQWLKAKYQKKGNAFLEAVHRLDKAASGIVVFAKTSKALSRVTTAIRNRHVKKYYRALVEGMPPSDSGTLEHYLVHGDHKAQVVFEHTPNAKRARLHYVVIERKEGQTLLEIELETGRYHQIRVQFAEIGCPIVGDMKYGSKVKWKASGIALHHCKLEISHPITKETMSFLSFFHTNSS